MTNERRLDLLSGRWTLIARSRQHMVRIRTGGLPEIESRCPFCPGHEADTEETRMQWPPTGPWQVRIVANRYPLIHTGPPSNTDADCAPIGGVHDVIIDSPAHDATLATMSLPVLTTWLQVIAKRYAVLEQDPSLQSIFFFRNRGRRAGSSQPHPHSQIVALDWVPQELATRWQRAQTHFVETRENIYHTLIRKAVQEEQRLLHLTDDFVSVCPFAPTRPYEVRIYPRRPNHPFSELTPHTRKGLAGHLLLALRGLCLGLGIEDFNLVLRAPPKIASGLATGWHLEILPRIDGDAGFELATQTKIVYMPPEDAAAQLRHHRSAFRDDDATPTPQ